MCYTYQVLWSIKANDHLDNLCVSFHNKHSQRRKSTTLKPGVHSGVLVYLPRIRLCNVRVIQDGVYMIASRRPSNDLISCKVLNVHGYRQCCTLQTIRTICESGKQGSIDPAVFRESDRHGLFEVLTDWPSGFVAAGRHSDLKWNSLKGPRNALALMCTVYCDRSRGIPFWPHFSRPHSRIQRTVRPSFNILHSLDLL